MKRRRVVAALVVGAVVCLGLGWGLARLLSDDAVRHGGTSVGVALESPRSITIEGEGRGLIRPGVMVPLDLSFDNPDDESLTLDRVTVRIAGIEAPRADDEHPCTMDDFLVRQLSGGPRLVITGDTVSTLSDLGVAEENWPAVGMRARPVNQDGCKDAVVTLAYEAGSTEAQP
jgi:hypothetical protein